jgi:glyoxylase-like metal-dependent hydrolase (beta-lactamase superfamily II)
MVSVLPSVDGGKYPHGHSVLVHGSSERVLIDPSLSIERTTLEAIGEVDRVLISHSHEDHLAGLRWFPSATVTVHESDRIGVESIDGLMEIYGMPDEIARPWRQEVLDRFHYCPRPGAATYTDGDVFDLGGKRLHVIHLPGHTRGHSGFLIEPDGVMFLADIDLTGFGPYYGDAWSSLDDFERSIERCRHIDAATFVTFHHKGTVHGRSQLLPLLDAYQAVIDRRERALLDYLEQPRTLDAIVAHRFVYRSHVSILFADAVERRSAILHLERFLARGLVTETAPGEFRSA